MKDECLICEAPLIYLETDEIMECAVCHKKEPSKTRCVNGHYVCNECHMAGLDSVMGVCLGSDSKSPIEILQEMMALPFCHMHGPEHHVMVGAALLTAYKNAGGALELEPALREMMSREEVFLAVPAASGARVALGSARACSFPSCRNPRRSV